MSIEVEVKCRVADYAALQQKLFDRYGQSTPYDKQDTYFSHNSHPEKALFRMRINGDRFEVTGKEKRIFAGVEQNIEHEFAISDPDQFRLFAAALGYAEFLTKHKHGETFTGKAGLRFDLSHVDKLGDYLEIELLLSDESDELQIKAARQRVLHLLTELGFSERDIEPRYYTDMLYEKKNDGGNS